MLKRALFVILNLLIIFAPDFIYFPKWTWAISLLGLLVLFDKKTTRNLGLFRKAFWIIISLWMFSFALSLVVPALYSTFDFSYSVILIGILLAIFRGIFLAYIGSKFLKLSLEGYIKVFVDVCLLYVLITFFLIMFPEIKNWWFNEFIIPTSVANPEYYPYRIGIEGFAGFSTAQIFSLGLLFNTFLILQPSKKSSVLLLSVKQIIIIIGCLLYGRVSIVPIVLSFLFLIGFSKDIKRNIKSIVTLVIIISISIYVLFIIGQNNPQINRWTQWAFELFINFAEKGEFSSHSSNRVFEEMIFFINPQTFLFGDGWYSKDGGYYMATDVGFMRPILFFGIFGLISNYGMLLVLINSIKKFFKRSKLKIGVILMLLILANAFTFEIKGESFQRFIYCLIPLYCMANNDWYSKKT